MSYREIKFRAWHKTENRMFEVYRLTWYHGIFLIGDENEKSPRFGSGEVELMQFSGLKDKHSTNIFEGDLLRLKTGLVECKWIESLTLFEFVSGVYRGNRCNAFGHNGDWSECEIVGNIYENPDLIPNVR